MYKAMPFAHSAHCTTSVCTPAVTLMLPYASTSHSHTVCLSSLQNTPVTTCDDVSCSGNVTVLSIWYMYLCESISYIFWKWFMAGLLACSKYPFTYLLFLSLTYLFSHLIILWTTSFSFYSPYLSSFILVSVRYCNHTKQVCGSWTSTQYKFKNPLHCYIMNFFGSSACIYCVL